MLANNIVALIVTFTLAWAWLRINDFAAHRGWISSDLSRKVIHIGTGPLFVLCWLLFADQPGARFLAAVVPFAITIQFILVGTGIIQDESAVKAMSRTGNRREILRGPLFYGFIFVAITLLYWKDSPIGMTALMLMCGGDGLADILGRRFGQHKLPWNPSKSWIGSLAMFLGGFLFALVVLAVFISFETFPGQLGGYLPALVLMSLAGALVESLPIRDIDNITTTLAAIAIGHTLL